MQKWVFKLVFLNKKDNIFKVLKEINLLEENFRVILKQVETENKTVSIEKNTNK